MEKITKLKNFGNSCYFNTALQILLDSPDLINEIMSEIRINKLKNTSLTFIFVNFIKSVRTESSNSNQLKEFYNKFCKTCGYDTGMQHDAFDALYSLLNQITEELCIEINMEHYKYYYRNYPEIDVKLVISNFKSNDFVISHFYMFTVLNTITGICGHKSYLTEFQGFINNYEYDIKITDSINNFFKETILEKWSCEECKRYQVAKQRKQIITLPKYIFVKSNKKKVNISKKIEMKNKIYEIKNVIIQEGSSTSGHYYILNNVNDYWIEINDDIVRPYSGNFVNSYFVIYKKID